MKLGLMKRMIATGLCAAMLFTDILPAKAMESVSSGNALEESVSGNDAVVTLEPVTVDGVTITVSGPASAFAEGTTVSAVAVSPAEVVIAAAEENEQATVKKYKAFDINLICEGQVVQPLNGQEIKVNFEGDMLIPDAENNEDVAVYHVDEDDNVTKMAAEVTPVATEEASVTETVEMTTTHFSTYVVVITGADYSVTYAHFADVDADGAEEQFYKPFSESVKAGTKKTYTDFKAAGKTVGGEDYEISYIVVDFADESKADIVIDANAADPANVDVTIESTATINIHYVPKDTTYINDVNFYDYYVNRHVQNSGRSFRAIVRADTNEEKNLDNIYANGKQYRTDSYNAESIRLQQRFTDNYITLQVGDELNDVTFNEVKFERAAYAGNGVFNEVNVISINDVGANYRNRFIGIGSITDRTKYGDFTALNGAGKANDMNGGNKAVGVVTGLVDGLTPDLKNVDWGKTASGQDIMEPGYFTDTESDTKVVYNNKEFKLKFNQSGHNFELFSAVNQETKRETYVKYQQSEFIDGENYKEYDGQKIKAGEISTEFFPLEDVPSRQVTEVYDGKEYNWYYGMRYDFTFTLGDYIGPLEYGFIGDDDLWVFVDGELVMDLGGVHSAYPTRYPAAGKAISVVDLWEEYFGVTEAERSNPDWWKNIEALADSGKYDPNKEYQVTVLYMERGGCASSCYMEFTLPNVSTRTVTENYGELSVVKKDSMTEEPVSGAEFTLYHDAACTSVAATATSNYNGNVRFSNLTAGDYYMKETSAPAGYHPTDKVWTVKVTEETVNDTTTVIVKLFDGNVEMTTGVITNDPVIDPIDAEFTKVDFYDYNKVLQGATFTLSDKSGRVLQTKVSDENGKVKFTGLEAGEYTVKETDAPEGYVLSDKVWTLTVTLSKADKKLSYTSDVPNNVLTNEPYADFEFTKINSENGEVLGGAEFTLYQGLKDSEKVALATATSDVNSGKVVFTDKMEIGKDYLLVETKTPDGYVQPKAPWVVRVDYENGKLVQNIYTATLVAGNWTYNSNSFVSNDVVENDPAYGSLKITKKVDEINMVYGAPSFTFKIEGPKDAVYYRIITFDDVNVKEKTIQINNLPVGDYTVTEMDDNVQYHLSTSDAGTKEVTETVTPVFTFENELEGNGYSHSDVVVNSFRRNENGGIDISKNREVMEETANGNQ